MLHFDDDKAGECFTDPFFIKIMGGLSLINIVAVPIKARAVGRFHIRIGGSLAETTKVGGKMTMKNHQRVFCFRVLIKSFRQQYMCAKLHILTPKLAEHIALHFDVLYIFGVFWRLNRGYFLIHGDFNGLCTIFGNCNLHRLTVEITGLAVPLLTLTHFRWQRDGFPV